MADDPFKYFRIEAQELLEGLSRGVLELEKGAWNEELLARQLRLAHTLKGAARVVKLPKIAEQAHAIEDVLAPYRDDQQPLRRQHVEHLLELVDAIAAALRSLGVAPGLPSGQPIAAAPPRAPDEPFETVRVELGEVSELLEGIAETGSSVGALFGHAGDLERAERLARSLADQLALRRHGARGDDAEQGGLSALAEELQASLARVRRKLSSGLERTQGELEQVRSRANRMRLVQAKTIFAPIERGLRDVAEGLGKRVTFAAFGGENRLDGHVLDALRDALIQMVKNAVDHGIEPEAERVRLGKPPVGGVTLAVERRGHRITFTCADDGRGVDVEAVHRSALERGLASAAEVAALERAESLRLIFQPGVSTHQGVTQVSGRGVGLDVVREVTARLKGELGVESERGRGTTLRITVPMSLSSMTALMVDAGGAEVAVPLDAVYRTLRLADGEITNAGEGDSVVFEGRAIPFVSLSDLLGRGGGFAARRPVWSTLVVRSGADHAAIGADRFLGTTEVVVRPLPQMCGALPMVAGACFDGQGVPQPVLDPKGLVDAARRRARAGRGELAAPPRKAPLLVIDDSLTTRMLEQSILESAGFEVHLATSAEEGLQKARERRYGLYVVDVEMPGMDGFEFVRRTRADPTLGKTPAMLVTSRAAPEDRQRGAEAGASDYMVKSEFDQDRFLATIRRLVG